MNTISQFKFPLDIRFGAGERSVPGEFGREAFWKVHERDRFSE